MEYRKELQVDLSYDGNKAGKYFLDFLIEDKIILEAKTVSYLDKKGIKQVLGYFNAKNLKLGIIVNFRTPKLESICILNSGK